MSTLSIDQLLRAAQILEHNATLQQQQQQLQSAFFQLGEDYQNKLIMPKMRAVHVELATAGGSTGSSRRSTPSGGMFSNCASTPSSSSPNSPPTTLLLSSNIAAAAAVAYSNDTYVQSTLALHNAASAVQHDAELLRQFEIPAATATCEQQQQIQIQQRQLQQHSPSGAQLDLTAGCSTSTASVVMLGFAPATQMRNSPSSSSITSMNVRQNRAAHNELEKNRRANLRGYLDSLKSVLPADVDAMRDTTLSLLTRARNHLRGMKKEKDALIEKRAKAMAEMMQLRQELASVGTAVSASADKSDKQQQLSQTQHEQSQIVEQQHEQQIEQQISAFASTSSAPCGINAAGAIDTTAPVSTGSFVLPTLPVSALDAWWTSQQQQEQKRQLEQLQQQHDHAAVKKAIDLYMEGLLPALPLLYPYNQVLARHSSSSTTNVNTAQRC